MDIAKLLLEQFRSVLREELKEELSNLIKENTYEKWVDKKELAKYLNVSESWINQRISEIPHVEYPIRFKISQVDEWRKEQKEKTEHEVVTQAKKTKNTFKIV